MHQRDLQRMDLIEKTIIDSGRAERCFGLKCSKILIFLYGRQIEDNTIRPKFDLTMDLSHYPNMIHFQ